MITDHTHGDRFDMLSLHVRLGFLSTPFCDLKALLDGRTLWRHGEPFSGPRSPMLSLDELVGRYIFEWTNGWSLTASEWLAPYPGLF